MSYRVWAAVGFVGHLLVLIVASSAIQMHSRCLQTETFSRLEAANWNAVACNRLLTGLKDARIAEPFQGKALVRELNALKALENVLPLPKRAIQVRVSDSSPFALTFVDHTLEIGYKLAQDGALLQKYLIMAWLRALAPNADQLDHLSWEVQAEVLTGWLSPQSRYGSSRGLTWLDGLMTFREYCNWEGRSPQHEEYCQSQNQLMTQTLDQPTVWGFRSVLAQNILQRLKVLSPPRQRKLIHEWNTNYKIPASRRLPEDYRSMTSFRSWFETSVQDWFAIVRPVDEGQYMMSLNPEVDLVIEGDLEITPSIKPSRAGKLMAEVYEGRVISPNLKKWTGFYADEIYARERLYIGCELPSVKTVISWRTEGAGFVRWCRTEPLRTSADNLLEHSLQDEISRMAPGHSFWLNLPLFRKTVRTENATIGDAVRELTL